MLFKKQSTKSKTEKIQKFYQLLQEADTVLIGAGAGLSAAAGFTYTDERFHRYFSDFASKYHFKDMYTGGFYPYDTLNEYWAYFSRYIYINRYMNPIYPVYRQLYTLIQEKDYFVITTNVDHCFQKSGFDKKRIFYTQGDYGLFQCSKPCHNETYENADSILEMVKAQGYRITENNTLYLPEGTAAKMTIPDDLIPRCIKCGKPMSMNLRADDTFVQNEGWYQAAKRYKLFIKRHQNSKILLLELGVGYNTPSIIKYPFWHLTAENPKSAYVCINNGEAICPKEIEKKSICIDGNIRAVFNMKKNPITDSLLKELITDSEQYKQIPIPAKEMDKKNLIRSLMNIRMPKSASQKLIKLQDAYLKKELMSKGIVTLADIPTLKEEFHCQFPYAEKLSLWQGDITRLKTEAIVNAANSQMLGCFVPCHGCIDNAIHSAAGIKLREECNRHMTEKRIRYGSQYEEPMGTAVLTNAYNLPCDFIIHTVGPIVRHKLNPALRQDLKNCYTNILKCCAEHNIKSIAFCCISTGEFHFPNDEAAKIAVETILDFLETNNSCLERIIFNVWKEKDKEIYQNLFLSKNLVSNV